MRFRAHPDRDSAGGLVASRFDADARSRFSKDQAEASCGRALARSTSLDTPDSGPLRRAKRLIVPGVRPCGFAERAESAADVRVSG